MDHHARIRNAGYLVRHYCRPGQDALRARAIAELAQALREALDACDNAEPVLVTVLDALAPRERRF